MLTAEQVIDRLGKDDPHPIGTVLHFFRRFKPEGQLYSYVAVKVDHGKWYITGQPKDVPYFTWESLILKYLAPALMETDQVYVATEWAKL